MFRGASLIMAALALAGHSQIVDAAPITYNFTAPLNEPIDGATSLTGSFTFDTTPTPAEIQSQGGLSVLENGSDVSLTVNVGEQVYQFTNDPRNPASGAGLWVFQVPAENEVMNQPTVEFQIGGQIGNNALFSIISYIPGITMSWVANPDGPPRNLSGIAFDHHFSMFSAQFGTNEWYSGEVTYSAEVAAPEPSMLTIFAGLGTALIITRRSRRFWSRPRRLSRAQEAIPYGDAN